MTSIFANASYGLTDPTGPTGNISIPTAVPLSGPIAVPISTGTPTKLQMKSVMATSAATATSDTSDTSGGHHLTLTRFLEDHGITPHSYQVDGIRWMDSMERDNGCGGILADDPGLGKTFQALALCHKGEGPNLIVVPTSILAQWIIEAERLFGARNVYVHHGPYRTGTIGRGVKIVLSTYGLLRMDKALQEVAWERVVLDEAHLIRNRRSKLSKAAMSLAARFRWGLTGTPIQNKDKEAINLFRFTCEDAVLEGMTLEELVEERLLRRTKEEELGDRIPGISIQEHNVDFISQEEQEFYNRVREGVAAEYRAVQGEEAKRENMVMFELLLRMRQASQHPQLVMNGFGRKFKRDYGRWMEVSSKHHALLDILRKDREQDTIVFCQFTEEMNILEQLLSREFEVTTLRGSSSVGHREHVIRMGQEIRVGGRQRVFLVQIMAGGVGLNLQAFSQVVLMAPDWNPCNEIQAVARAHRLGQKRHVTVHKLSLTSTLNDTIDQRINIIQANKLNRIHQLLLHTHTHTHTHTRTHTHTHFRKLLA